MKILKEGRKQKGWSKECICTGNGNGNGGCGAKLLIEIADVYKTYRNCRDETDTYFTFKCVSCDVETDFNYTGPEEIISDKINWIKNKS